MKPKEDLLPGEQDIVLPPISDDDRRFPIDYKPVKKNKQTPANELTDQVIQFLFQIGGAGRRVNTQGQWREGETIEEGFGYRLKKAGKFTPSGMKKGFEDVAGIFPLWIKDVKVGVYLAVEIKIGPDTLRPEQLERKQEVEQAGGRYIVAKSMDQFKDKLRVNFPLGMQRLEAWLATKGQSI